MNNQKYLAVALQAAKDAGPIFKQFFGKPKIISIKNHNPRDLVTEIDLKIEKLIKQIIHKNFPDHGIMGEEFGWQKNTSKSEIQWFVDPIDGTSNFTKGLNICCISIACWKNDTPLVGVVYNPITNEQYTAVKGQGAKKNGKTISVSQTKKPANALGGIGWGRDIEIAKKLFIKYVDVAKKVRTLGSGALELCLVAEGKFDFLIHGRLNIWDIAASALVVQEAGGKITETNGKPISSKTTNVIASNNTLHKALLSKLKKLG